jgi:hypothetical protein
VYKEIKSQSDTIELQKDLIALEEWEKTWGMKAYIHLYVVPCMP